MATPVRFLQIAHHQMAEGSRRKQCSRYLFLT